MQLHKFDTQTKNAHLHIWRSQPATPEEWIEHWTNEGGIWIPCSRGNRPVFLAIRHITPVSKALKDKADFLVDAADSKPFYIKFAREERAFSPLSRPTLVIPYCSMRQAWWLLSAN
ncbi:MAG: hypothetical protein R3E62_06385 [Pseudomonadales bacterium]|jgi:hypothetical protein